MGTGRYLMAAFPAFALWGERLTARPVPQRVVALEERASCLLFFGFHFAASVYLT